jgi:hypothetical protein
MTRMTRIRMMMTRAPSTSAKAQVAQLEGRIANHKFRAEALILRTEIKQEPSWIGPYYTNEDYEYDYQQARYRYGNLGQKVAAWVDAAEVAMGSGKQGSKRGRLEMEEDEEAVEQLPSPPTKRAKFKFPCVVRSCDKGYKNKANLQRHVFERHDRVSDPVAKRACRLLWGETFKRGRLEEINRRYGEGNTRNEGLDVDRG